MRDELPYTVDRISADDAVLHDDERREVRIPRRSLPHGLSAGTVVRVPVIGGRPDWSLARIDRISTELRFQEAAPRVREPGRE